MSTRDTTGIFRQGAGTAVRMIFIVIAVIAGLAIADTFLEKTEQAELDQSARRSHASGLQLLKEGHTLAAVDALNKAHALERNDVQYELDLIQGLIAAGKIDEAQPLMREVLEDEPNDGQADLIAARLASRMGRTADAESLYHRAIYGEWPVDDQAHQTAARLELINFLISKGRQNEVLAELLPLEQPAASNWQLQQKLGHLFLIAGSPSRAADTFHALIQQRHDDAAVYTGLGEAEMEEGNFHSAHSAFATASAKDPEDAAIHQQLNLSTALTALDPTPRGLRSSDKYHRSLRILQLADDDLTHCIANHPEVATNEAKDLIASANEALSATPPKMVTNEMSEGLLASAEKLWQVRIKSCGSAAAPDTEPLRLIMEKLAK